MSPRKLRPEERQLWDQVAKTTDRLFPERPKEPPTPDPKPLPPLKTRGQTALRHFSMGQYAPAQTEVHQQTRSMRDRLSADPVQMDSRTHGKLTRGKLKPEARIDLHGMTQSRAHPALISFILRAHDDGKRLVLVITGKGSPDDAAWPIPRRRGVLRQLVPEWLRTGPTARVVLQVVPAHQRHGGAGAYYVYLKRRR